MSVNWINHSPSSTPKRLIDDDIAHVEATYLYTYFQRVRVQFLTGEPASRTSLPQHLYERVSACAAEDVASVLQRAISEGGVMDTGWFEDYVSISNCVAESMGGYPRACRKQWRGITEAAMGVSDDQERLKSQTHASPAIDGNEEKNKEYFRFLDLPDNLRTRIIHLIAAPGPLTITDWAVGSTPPTFKRRTEYEVPDQNNELRRTTYLVHSHTSPSSTTNTMHALLLTNKLLHSHIGSILYNASFHFRGTASSTLAFLHDQGTILSKLKKISLRYTMTSKTPFLGCTRRDQGAKPPPTLKTNFDVWRKIISLLRRRASALEDFELVVDKSFWERVPWRGGVDEVLNSPNLCSNLTLSAISQQRKRKLGSVTNFLCEVATLSGVNFRLVLDGRDLDQAQKAFRRDLEKQIGERIQRNEYLAVKGKACLCRKRLLSEACVWDGNGDEGVKKRRGEDGGCRRCCVLET